MSNQPGRDQSQAAPSEPGIDLMHLCRYSCDLSPQPMIAVEGTTHIVRYLNAAFEHLAGKPREALMGHPFAEAVPEGETNGCLALLDRVYHSGQPEILAEQEHSQDSPSYWTYSVWAILGTDEGADNPPVGVMVQVTDATEVAIFRKRAVEMNGQLLLSATSQHELTQAAETANRLKDDFLATLSHELRTPLTAIMGWAQLLGDSSLDPVTSIRAVEVIRRNAQVQGQLIDDLLDIVRIASGKLRLDVQPIDPGIFIVAAVDTLLPAARAKEIHVQSQLDSSPGQVLGDSDRLQQVAWNLISNAIKFTPHGGHIRVRMERIDSRVEISVSDNGAGIKPEFLPHVFDRFRQADASSTRTFGGLGLGLAIVRQLVELHGGTVRAHSDGEELGSTFTFSLPLMRAHSAESEMGSASKGTASPMFQQSAFQCATDLDGLRVLVVDDEMDACELLQVILTGCGAQVKTATSAAAALEAVGAEVFDILISDIGMPEEDGYSLIAKMRALAKERGGKVPAAAALTAYVSENDRIRVLQSGFQIHVPKPISPSELIAVVANLAGRVR